MTRPAHHQSLPELILLIVENSLQERWGGDVKREDIGIFSAFAADLGQH